MTPIVALVGRPNVGKSTLFNRLIQTRLAIEEDEPGVTRDRIYADTSWSGHSFTLIDTGGLVLASDEPMPKAVREQAEAAMTEADLLLFVVDGQEGITAADEEVAHLLRRSKKPVRLVVNKAEGKERLLTADFYRLGLGDPIAVSATHGRGTGDLLDVILSVLSLEEAEQEPEGEMEEDPPIRVAVVGRPNVGKSTLINRILGEERLITSEVAGTTRDAIDVPLEQEGGRFVFVDTAGLRRKSRIDARLERHMVLRSLRAIDRADVVVLLINASEGVTAQEQKIAGYVHERGKGLILGINKWDLIEKDDKTSEKTEKTVRFHLPFIDYAPVIFLSAATGQRVGRLLHLIQDVYREITYRVPTAVLNEVVGDALASTPPPTDKGRRLKVFYASQPSSQPPTFVFFVNNPDLVHFSYRRYLVNRLRAAFPLQNAPIKLVFRPRT